MTQNSGYSPVILKNGNGAERRVSFTAQSAGLFALSVTSVMGAGAYTFRSTDTTFINVRWNRATDYSAGRVTRSSAVWDFNLPSSIEVGDVQSQCAT